MEHKVSRRRSHRKKEEKSYKETLAEKRKNIGKLSHPKLMDDLIGRKNEVATKDAIRHFANGIGDPNPLWRDENYARNSRYGGIIAPPLFLNAILIGMGGEYVPGFLPFVAGCEWEWFRTIHVNDAITVVDIPVQVEEKTEEKAPRRLLEIGKRIYRNQRDEIVGIGKRMTMSVEDVARAAAKVETNPTYVRGYKYSEEELEAIDKAYEEEEIRGSNPRYWGDVSVGDELKPVIKGPLSHGDMVAFLIGISFMDEAHGLSRRIFKKHPFWAYSDPETGVTEWANGAHLVDRIAQSFGLPSAIALGVQACCWLGHMLTNWMGDDGFLKKLDMQCRTIIPHGDTTWCRGKVIKKYAQDDDHLVDCEIWGENQKGIRSTVGHATVILPSFSA